MEPTRQAEIQLGHMCNNRCVFCVSGQRTSWGEAGPMPVEPILEHIEAAHAHGLRKITLLGGEPTLQPGFKAVLQRCAALGFEEVVLFTNGVKTARGSYIDELIALGAPLRWRLSLQGATAEAHEATTRRPGSFGRILATLEGLRERGERVSANMCVVKSNAASVQHFPELIERYGIDQLHLDMMRPRDAGVREEEELRAILPSYAELRGPLTALAQGVAGDFDLNIGNLPYCVAPHLARWIHHDGEMTYTVSVDGDDALSAPWDKYEDKRTDKLKTTGCASCVFTARCSGTFETYRDFYGLEELEPVNVEQLREADPNRRVLWPHLWAAGQRAAALGPLAAFGAAAPSLTADNELELHLEGEPGELVFALRPASEVGLCGFADFSIHLRSAPDDEAGVYEALLALFEGLLAGGERPVHPPGRDLLGRGERRLRGRLGRLRAAAPFGELRWTALELSVDGQRAELSLEGPEGARLTFWLAQERSKPSGGYRVEGGEPGPATVEGLKILMGVLRG
ncbi:MAG: radical SAM protein [Deltaproteobacteria bacterium]|nr:radical SAM protein [Deltaproteobacteria bacterium]